jgi:hypothetical protein
MKFGYIIASREVTERGMPIGYLYREEPDSVGRISLTVVSWKFDRRLASRPTSVRS